MGTHRPGDLLEHARLRAAEAARTSESDAHLLARFVEHRDETAFAVLVRRHGAMVWSVCRRLLGHHAAEDAFQATFLVLARKAAAVRPREAVAAWLHGVAYRAACKLRTARHRRREEAEVEPAVCDPATDDLRPLLDHELARLPDRHRAAVLLCDLEGLTRPEAAARLGVPEGTVAGWQARGRAKLAARLARRGVVPAVALSAAAHVDAACVAAIRSAIPLATREAAVIPTPVAALANGVTRAMLFTRLKLALAAAVVCSAALTAASLTPRGSTAAGGEPVPQAAATPKAETPKEKPVETEVKFETVVKRDGGGPKQSAEVVIRSEKEWEAFTDTVPPGDVRDELVKQKFDFDKEVVAAVVRGGSQSVPTKEDGVNKVLVTGDTAVVEWTAVESDQRESENSYPFHVIKMPKVKEVKFKKAGKFVGG